MSEYVVKKEVKIELEEYHFLRGIKVNVYGQKIVTAESEFSEKPTEQQIAEFLYRTDATFASLEHNYRIKADVLPFS